MNIVIQGATSRIAHECARLWARQGARLVLLGRDAARLDGMAADLRAVGASVSTRVVDGDDAAIAPAVADIARELGGIDVALIAHGWLPDQAATQRDAAALRQAVEVNALSPALWAEAFAAVFEAQRRGTLAVIGSVAGDRGRQSNYSYGAAKGFVERHCQGLRNRLHPAGVAVVLIKPGPTDTPMTRGMSLPEGARRPRLADPAAVAGDIVRGIAVQRAVIYTPGIWRWIMTVIRWIPERVFVRLKL